MKKYFSQTKERTLKNSSYSWSKCCKKQRNRKTSENISIGIKQTKLFMDINIQSGQSIINCSQLIQVRFRLPFLMCLVTFAHILLTSLLFVSCTIFRTVSKVKKKECFGKKFCNFKILFEQEIYISYIPYNDYSNFKSVIFFSLPHKNIQIPL